MSALACKASVDPLLVTACMHACNGFLRFSYGVTPADLLMASLAADLIP